MQTEETKNNGNKCKGIDFRCCNPEDFQKMFEKMSKCCPDQDDATDFTTMKEGMMKNMMGMCCGHKKTDTKGDADLKKEMEGDTKSTEKQGCCS